MKGIMFLFLVIRKVKNITNNKKMTHKFNGESFFHKKILANSPFLIIFAKKSKKNGEFKRKMRKIKKRN